MYTETMRFMLDLLPLQTRHKVEQVKTNFSAAKKKKNYPLHETAERLKDNKLTGTRQYLKWVLQWSQAYNM